MRRELSPSGKKLANRIARPLPGLWDRSWAQNPSKYYKIFEKFPWHPSPAVPVVPAGRMQNRHRRAAKTFPRLPATRARQTTPCESQNVRRAAHNDTSQYYHSSEILKVYVTTSSSHFAPWMIRSRYMTPHAQKMPTRKDSLARTEEMPATTPKDLWSLMQRPQQLHNTHESTLRPS